MCPDPLASSVLSVGADWVTNISDRAPLSGLAEDGTAYNTNLPSLTEVGGEYKCGEQFSFSC